jgi:hypothetical protein
MPMECSNHDLRFLLFLLYCTSLLDIYRIILHRKEASWRRKGLDDMGRDERQKQKIIGRKKEEMRGKSISWPH